MTSFQLKQLWKELRSTYNHTYDSDNFLCKYRHGYFRTFTLDQNELNEGKDGRQNHGRRAQYADDDDGDNNDEQTTNCCYIQHCIQTQNTTEHESGYHGIDIL